VSVSGRSPGVDNGSQEQYQPQDQEDSGSVPFAGDDVVLGTRLTPLIVKQ